MEVGHLSDDALLLVANSAVRVETPFVFYINKKPPTYSDFLDRARNYINTEALTSKNSGTAKTSLGDPERGQRKEKKRPAGGSQQLRDDKKHRDSRPGNELV